MNSLVKMMAVLNCFTLVHAKLSAAEIAHRTRIPRPTVHRLVATMVNLGLLDQVRRRDHYTLGTTVLGLGVTMLANLDLNHVARVHVEALKAATGETVHLAVFDGTNSIVVNSGNSQAVEALQTYVLKTTPANACSTGKAALAFQPAETIDRFLASGLRKVAPKTISDPRLLREELALCHKRGYAIDDEESEPGVRCVGVPIRNASGRVFAALSVSGRKSEMDDARIRSLTDLVLHYAEAISIDLGYEV
ncbi:IclR family transcriptional regulator [Martelella soudanensis]|uniref:IclR family transcriptional regulator n=1 Tax=unclassified Martelella TaxID=2629616 RepID=UPI0015DF2993|nr:MULTISPECIES: IclR family transcriptional regulator [unclassified Martelella]